MIHELKNKLEHLVPALNGGEVDPQRLEAGLQRLERFTHVMEELFVVPVLNKRVGLETLLGMVPVAGDALGWVLSLYTLVEASYLGAPPRLLLEMVGRHALDALIGAVPLVGDLFDVYYKANRRNLESLRTYLNEALEQRRVVEIQPGMAPA